MDKPRISACMVLYHAGDEALRAVDCLDKSDMPVEVYLVTTPPRTTPPNASAGPIRA